MHMMTFRWALCAFAAFAFAATEAQARRGGGLSSTYEHLVLVQPLVENGQERSLALCHLVETHAVFFVPVWTTLQGYALAENRCDTERFRAVGPDDIAFLRDKGAIDARLPLDAKMGGATARGNWMTLGVVGALLGFGLLSSLVKAFSGGGRRMRSGKLGKLPPVAYQTIDAMCHVAKVDGHVDREEVNTIAGIAERLTRQPVDPGAVREMIDAASAGRVDYGRFTKGLTGNQGRIVLQGALLTAAADGDIQHQELGFMISLSNALGIGQFEFEQMMREAVSPA